MKRGIIAFIVVMAIGVATYFIYQQSLQPKYKGEWQLVDGEEACFVEVEFSPGPKDYKGTVLKQVDGNNEISYLGGHKIEDGQIVVDIFNFDDVEPIKMDHEKSGSNIELSYDWEGESLQCTYEQE